MAFPMTQLPSTAEPPFGFWDYFEVIPPEDFEGHDCSAGRVTYAWDHPDKSFQHVLVDSEVENVFMVLVLDVTNRCVVGHRLLDLNQEYGISPSDSSIDQV